MRIRTHYSYSDQARYEALCREWQDEISENLRALAEMDDYLKSMETPFDFFKDSQV